MEELKQIFNLLLPLLYLFLGIYAIIGLWVLVEYLRDKLLTHIKKSTILQVGILFLCISLSGCAYCNGELFIGWGSYKNKDFEMSSDPPLKDIVSINAVKD
ncbi:MAG TPA: hypothetical protein ENH85_14100 [Candidatus Scalindua sp.]|nr:hypothetical protein [Candidatus Scalindua sp.]